MKDNTNTNRTRAIIISVISLILVATIVFACILVSRQGNDPLPIPESTVTDQFIFDSIVDGTGHELTDTERAELITQLVDSLSLGSDTGFDTEGHGHTYTTEPDITSEDMTDPDTINIPDTDEPETDSKTEVETDSDTGIVTDHETVDPVTGHVHHFTSKVIKPATCGESGLITYTCECGYSYTETIPATEDHKWGSWTTVKDPTCTEKGKKERSCSVCHTKGTSSIPTIDHNFVKGQVIEPSLVAEGYTEYVCSMCGKIDKRDKKPKVSGTGSIPTGDRATCEHRYVKVGVYDKNGNPNPKKNKIAYDFYICEKCGDSYRQWLTGEGTTASFQNYKYIETVYVGDDYHWTVEKWSKDSATPEGEEYVKEFYRFRTQREGDYIGESDGIESPYDIRLYFGDEAFASILITRPLSELSGSFGALTTNRSFLEFPFITNLRLEKDGDIYYTMMDVYWTANDIRYKYVWRHLVIQEQLDQTNDKQLHQHIISIGNSGYPSLHGNIDIGTYYLKESDVTRLN